MREFFKHILTGIDNRTYDLARVLGFTFGLQFIFLGTWAVIVNKQPFDFMQYGGGAGSVLTALGIAISLKRKAEPQAPPT